MSPNYYITEPHPTVLQNTYVHSGRGGAGNLFRAPLTTPSTGVPTPAKPTKPSSSRFYSGRGGAGNVHSAAERPVLSLDEEYALASAREKAAAAGGTVGRGGAGNFCRNGENMDRKASIASDISDRRDSTSSSGSVRSGFFGRLASKGSGRHGH